MGNTTGRKTASSQLESTSTLSISSLATEAAVGSLHASSEDVVNNQSSNSLLASSSSIPNTDNPLKKSLIFRFEDGHVFGDGLELDLLPLELWELILSFCENDILAVNIPRVCKVLYNVTNADSSFWRTKCKEKFGSEFIMQPAEEAWKRLYFTDRIKLFPLLGFKIGISKHSELKKAPGALPNVSGTSHYVTINSHNFWVEDGEQGCFTFMYIVRGIYPLPENRSDAIIANSKFLVLNCLYNREWERQGITWDKSFNDYTKMFKKWPGNYRVEKEPTQEEFMGKACFSARLTTIAKEHDTYYQIDMAFGYVAGNVDTSGTLYSLSITSGNAYGGNTAPAYQMRYEARKAEDKQF